MPITVSGTSITFNDATTQSTAGITSAVTSLNGSTGAITNTGFNNIGSYTAGVRNSNSTSNPGDTIAGSTLYQYSGSPYTQVQTNIGGASNRGQTGTWRAMAYNAPEILGCGPDYARGSNIWVRIS